MGGGTVAKRRMSRRTEFILSSRILVRLGLRMDQGAGKVSSRVIACRLRRQAKHILVANASIWVLAKHLALNLSILYT
jgi:hypothetical protein